MRRKPYTEKGIKRVPCFRCGKPSSRQWQICSLKNEYKGLCTRCDIELNILVLDFMGYNIVDKSVIITSYKNRLSESEDK